MRYRRILVSGVFLIDLCIEGSISNRVRCIKGLPEGTKFVYAIPDARNYGIWFVVEHESFDTIESGGVIPEMDSPAFESME